MGRENKPEQAGWSTIMKTNLILADIYDALNQLNANMIAIATGKASKRIKPYPRPFERKNNDKNVQHYGSKPLPVQELENWFTRKREEREQWLKEPKSQKPM